MIGKVTCNEPEKMPKTHTPGPWKVVKPGHGHRTKYKCVQIGSDDRYTTLEMLPADARLIAAAPELLEACQAALHVAMQGQKWLLAKDWFDNLRPVLEAAIAKAAPLTARQTGGEG